ncbi:hypothetical protein ACN082_05925 [Rothia sp. CCM 9417]|uniref:hypothetical protein n=1 Tax=unclassified Rothia (in: high G+C Gram-positive bacteria) TaxID=2689056 RepID=UPI003AE422B4
MTPQISRRNIAKGAAWAAPAVIATSAIPAYAASSSDRTPNDPLGTICSLFFGGGNVNSQTTSVYLAVESADGFIHAGETVSWVVDMSRGTVPGLNYPQDGSWTLTTSVPKGQSATQFVVTLTANQDVPVQNVNCVARMIWDGSASAGSSNISPKSTLSVSSSGNDTTYSSKITIPKRYGTSVNDSSRTPVYIDGACYPTIQWSYLGNSTKYDLDDLLVFNGGSSIKPDSHADNNQKVTTGTC